MSGWASIVAHHGYGLVALLVFLEAIGLPMPAALVLIAAGAASTTGILRPGLVLASAIPAILIGDSILFMVGRHTGWKFLNVLCRIAINPESCVLRSAESFYKRGRITLLIAKFVPGLNSMA